MACSGTSSSSKGSSASKLRAREDEAPTAAAPLPFGAWVARQAFLTDVLVLVFELLTIIPGYVEQYLQRRMCVPLAGSPYAALQEVPLDPAARRADAIAAGFPCAAGPWRQRGYVIRTGAAFDPRVRMLISDWANLAHTWALIVVLGLALAAPRVYLRARPWLCFATCAAVAVGLRFSGAASPLSLLPLISPSFYGSYRKRSGITFFAYRTIVSRVPSSHQLLLGPVLWALTLWAVATADRRLPPPGAPAPQHVTPLEAVQLFVVVAVLPYLAAVAWERVSLRPRYVAYLQRHARRHGTRQPQRAPQHTRGAQAAAAADPARSAGGSSSCASAQVGCAAASSPAGASAPATTGGVLTRVAAAAGSTAGGGSSSGHDSSPGLRIGTVTPTTDAPAAEAGGRSSAAPSPPRTTPRAAATPSDVAARTSPAQPCLDVASILAGGGTAGYTRALLPRRPIAPGCRSVAAYRPAFGRPRLLSVKLPLQHDRPGGPTFAQAAARVSSSAALAAAAAAGVFADSCAADGAAGCRGAPTPPQRLSVLSSVVVEGCVHLLMLVRGLPLAGAGAGGVFPAGAQAPTPHHRARRAPVLRHTQLRAACHDGEDGEDGAGAAHLWSELDTVLQQQLGAAARGEEGDGGDASGDSCSAEAEAFVWPPALATGQQGGAEVVAVVPCALLRGLAAVRCVVAGAAPGAGGTDGDEQQQQEWGAGALPSVHLDSTVRVEQLQQAEGSGEEGWAAIRLPLPVLSFRAPGLLALHLLPGAVAAGGSSAPLATLPLLVLPGPAAHEVVRLVSEVVGAEAATQRLLSELVTPQSGAAAAAAGPCATAVSAPAASSASSALSLSGLQDLVYDVGTLLQLPLSSASTSPADPWVWSDLLRLLAERRMGSCLELCLGALQRGGVALSVGGRELGGEGEAAAAGSLASAVRELLHDRPSDGSGDQLDEAAASCIQPASHLSHPHWRDRGPPASPRTPLTQRLSSEAAAWSSPLLCSPGRAAPSGLRCALRLVCSPQASRAASAPHRTSCRSLSTRGLLPGAHEGAASARLRHARSSSLAEAGAAPPSTAQPASPISTFSPRTAACPKPGYKPTPHGSAASPLEGGCSPFVSATCAPTPASAAKAEPGAGGSSGPATPSARSGTAAARAPGLASPAGVLHGACDPALQPLTSGPSTDLCALGGRSSCQLRAGAGQHPPAAAGRRRAVLWWLRAALLGFRPPGAESRYQAFKALHCRSWDCVGLALVVAIRVAGLVRTLRSQSRAAAEGNAEAARQYGLQTTATALWLLPALGALLLAWGTTALARHRTALLMSKEALDAVLMMMMMTWDTLPRVPSLLSLPWTHGSVDVGAATGGVLDAAALGGALRPQRWLAFPSTWQRACRRFAVHWLFFSLWEPCSLQLSVRPTAALVLLSALPMGAAVSGGSWADGLRFAAASGACRVLLAAATDLHARLRFVAREQQQLQRG